MKILLQINDIVLMMALILVLLNEMENNINEHEMASTNCDIIFILHRLWKSI